MRHAFLCLAAALLSAPAASQDLKRGEYLSRIMDCGGCHTPGAMAGKPDMKRSLAGGDIGFELPGLGIFYPPNLTPDRESGLGAWTISDIVKAVREGVRPDGRQLAPIMPWPSYAALTDADANALAAYLKSLPAVAEKVPGPMGPTEKSPKPYLSVKMPQ
jgi:mono/diheme cytochrome c family protein